MTDTALLTLALVVSFAGMALFALSIGAHWQQLVGSKAHPRVLRIGLRIAGTTQLAIAFWLCALADPVSMATLVWPMLLTVSAVAVAAALAMHSALKRRAEDAAAGKKPIPGNLVCPRERCGRSWPG